MAEVGPAPRELRVGIAQAGRRLDQVLAEALPEFSRSRIQRWIEAGQVQVEGRVRRCRDRVQVGERILCVPTSDPVGDDRAEAIPLTVVFEDSDLLVVDKPADLVVHPAAGNPDGTLLNALLHHCPALRHLPRSGLVHRLDKDTTGLLVVAKTLAAHTALVRQLQERSMHREYRALVNGTMRAGGRIEAPIGRHPVQRKRMAVVSSGRPAVTHYRILERFSAQTLIGVRLETGRTHQIRVHLAHVRHPLVGDPVYGGRPRRPKGASSTLIAALQGFPRQALHAVALGLTHPRDRTSLHFEVPLAADLAALIDTLRKEQNLDVDRTGLAGAG
ncbi:23S rRNA pseudouridine(1911/1915/1917) synthase RluD [Thioalkalicoccus limnaeus]|uniref:Pseudouridine synthase n=1 Tax=Thioalkalicoccus limnaeus TaxID=120681 RepID=A0ABV4BHF1_9GAMM